MATALPIPILDLIDIPQLLVDNIWKVSALIGFGVTALALYT